MKKLLSIVLASLMIFSTVFTLASCDGEDKGVKRVREKKESVLTEINALILESDISSKDESSINRIINGFSEDFDEKTTMSSKYDEVNDAIISLNLIKSSDEKAKALISLIVSKLELIKIEIAGEDLNAVNNRIAEIRTAINAGNGLTSDEKAELQASLNALNTNLTAIFANASKTVEEKRQEANEVVRQEINRINELTLQAEKPSEATLAIYTLELSELELLTKELVGIYQSTTEKLYGELVSLNASATYKEEIKSEMGALIEAYKQALDTKTNSIDEYAVALDQITTSVGIVITRYENDINKIDDGKNVDEGIDYEYSEPVKEALLLRDMDKVVSALLDMKNIYMALEGDALTLELAQMSDACLNISLASSSTTLKEIFKNLSEKLETASHEANPDRGNDAEKAKTIANDALGKSANSFGKFVEELVAIDTFSQNAQLLVNEAKLSLTQANN